MRKLFLTIAILAVTAIAFAETLYYVKDGVMKKVEISDFDYVAIETQLRDLNAQEAKKLEMEAVLNAYYELNPITVEEPVVEEPIVEPAQDVNWEELQPPADGVNWDGGLSKAWGQKGSISPVKG